MSKMLNTLESLNKGEVPYDARDSSTIIKEKLDIEESLASNRAKENSK
jgi:hypothetical protein